VTEQTLVLDVPRAAQQLGVSPLTVRRYLASGKMQGFRLPGGSLWRIPASELERLTSLAPADQHPADA
jgi:excisionase family DNA binding protein